MHVPGLRVIEPVSVRFAATVRYQKDRLLKDSSLYDNNVTRKLLKMAKKIAVQMKDHTFSGKNPRSVRVFLKEIKSACNACEIHEIAAMGCLSNS